MNDQIVDNLLQEYELYSQVQGKLAQAILECDETTVVAMELEGREILERLEPKLSLVVTSVADCQTKKKVSPEGFQSLVQCIEESQVQVSRNQNALSQWKNEIGITLQKLSSPSGKSGFQELDENPSAGTAARTPSSISPTSGVFPSHSTWEPPLEKTQIGQKFDRLS